MPLHSQQQILDEIAKTDLSVKPELVKQEELVQGVREEVEASVVEKTVEKNFQEIEMGGVTYEFPSDMDDEEIGEILQKEATASSGKRNNEKELQKDLRPRGVRNNNPGNIEFSERNDWVGQTGIEKHADPRFSNFDKPESGIRAMLKLFQTYNKRGQKDLDTMFRGIVTAEGRVSGYAPDKENDTDNYIKFLTKRTGIGEFSEIDISDFDTLIKLLPAVVRMEQGYDPYDKSLYAGVLEGEGIKQTSEQEGGTLL